MKTNIYWSYPYEFLIRAYPNIMQITFLPAANNQQIAHIASHDTIIETTQDAVELLMNCQYQGADSIILHEHNLPVEFFDLSTQLPGDILQKFSTYGSRLAIVGDFSKHESKSLRDFIYESNKGRKINFVSSVEEAVNALA